MYGVLLTLSVTELPTRCSDSPKRTHINQLPMVRTHIEPPDCNQAGVDLDVPVQVAGGVTIALDQPLDRAQVLFTSHNG